MKFPQLRPRKKIGDLAQKDKIFAEASDLARLRLEQCMTDLNERIRTAEETADQHGSASSDRSDRAAA